mmetsp:Transcript_7032/g.22018  ORF Transcript_7032/g.22018 Transcript_7032/m.22018 type:complete len:396 (-) Transcript_7032:443-1630(-)
MQISSSVQLSTTVGSDLGGGAAGGDVNVSAPLSVRCHRLPLPARLFRCDARAVGVRCAGDCSRLGWLRRSVRADIGRRGGDSDAVLGAACESAAGTRAAGARTGDFDRFLGALDRGLRARGSDDAGVRRFEFDRRTGGSAPLTLLGPCGGDRGCGEATGARALGIVVRTLGGGASSFAAARLLLTRGADRSDAVDVLSELRTCADWRSGGGACVDTAPSSRPMRSFRSSCSAFMSSSCWAAGLAAGAPLIAVGWYSACVALSAMGPRISLDSEAPITPLDCDVSATWELATRFARFDDFFRGCLSVVGLCDGCTVAAASASSSSCSSARRGPERCCRMLLSATARQRLQQALLNRSATASGIASPRRSKPAMRCWRASSIGVHLAHLPRVPCTDG